MPRGIPGSGPSKPQKNQGPRAPVLHAKDTHPTPPAEAAQGDPEGNHPTDVDRMAGEHLRAYARKTGVTPRDVDSLPDDRLRQSVKLLLAARYEDD